MKLSRTTPVANVERESAPASTMPAIGSWGLYAKERGNPVLACVLSHGSNYFEVGWGSGGRSRARVHADQYADVWKPLQTDEATQRIEAATQKAREESTDLLNQIHELTARLGTGDRVALSAKQEVGLVIANGERLDEYKSALVQARDKRLPELFSQLREAHERLVMWASYETLPISAQLEGLTGQKKNIEKRLGAVSLYGGLEEHLQCINPNAAPAGNDEPVHLWQDRRYVDEEYAARWSAGGARMDNVPEFLEWLSRPDILPTILPSPRSVVAWRVRRKDVEFNWNHPLIQQGNFVGWLQLIEEDKTTFLTIRNGDQLWALQCPVKFPEKLFPNAGDLTFTSGDELWFHDGAHMEVITKAQLDARVVEASATAVRHYVKARRSYLELKERWLAETHKDARDHLCWLIANRTIDNASWGLESSLKRILRDRSDLPPWKSLIVMLEADEEAREQVLKASTSAREAFTSAGENERARWERADDSSVKLDDVLRTLQDRVVDHNRIVLVLQGLLDRSRAFHPHPPWRLSDPAGFQRALVLHHEGTTLVAGPPPDFEQYLKENQSTIRVGSTVWGAEKAWRRRNAQRESAERRRRGRSGGYERDLEETGGMYGDDGPGEFAVVQRISRGKALFTWLRDRARYDPWERKVRDSIWVPLEGLFNVRTYVPGTFKQFLADPRTRPNYLRFGAVLQAAERWHAEKAT